MTKFRKVIGNLLTVTGTQFGKSYKAHKNALNSLYTRKDDFSLVEEMELYYHGIINLKYHK